MARSSKSIREYTLVTELNRTKRRLGKIDAEALLERLLPNDAKFSAAFDSGSFDVDPSAPTQITVASLRRALEAISDVPPPPTRGDP